MKYFSYFSRNMNFECKSAASQWWKANIIKTQFRQILFTRCNNVVSIALNQISFDDKGFAMDTDERDPFFFPCISHLYRINIRESFVCMVERSHGFKYLYLTFIQLMINSERISDYSAYRIICNSFRE